MAYEETERTQVGANSFVEHLQRIDRYVRQGGRWRLQAMTAVLIPQAPPTIELSAAQREEYVGAYQFAPNAVSIVRIEGARLVEQTTGQQQGELHPIGPDLLYEPPDIEARIAFERDATGRVVAQIYRSGTQSLRAPRIDD